MSEPPIQHLFVLTRPAGDGESYVAWCPDLPGWTASGADRETASNNAHEIVTALVAQRAASGPPIVARHSAVAVPLYPGPATAAPGGDTVASAAPPPPAPGPAPTAPGGDAVASAAPPPPAPGPAPTPLPPPAPDPPTISEPFMFDDRPPPASERVELGGHARRAPRPDDESPS